MEELLKNEAISHGDQLQVIPIHRLEKLKENIDDFKEHEELNGFQKWIVNDLYKFTEPSLDFPIHSIIIVAVKHPAYANVEFTKEGKKYNFLSLVMSDFEETEKYLKDLLTPKNYHIKAAYNLPLKRLGVHSGLAVYGKNNISYVEGMGSYFSYVAYFSDIIPQNDHWFEVQQATRCDNCNICLKTCPTGAIRKERFLIDNERCLSYFNENPRNFPNWLPTSVHHTLYDCLKCQIHCPMNIDYKDHILDSIKFNEEETLMLRSGVKIDEFPMELKQKSKKLGLNDWLEAIPRNLNILFQLSDSK